MDALEEEGDIEKKGGGVVNNYNMLEWGGGHQKKKKLAFPIGIINYKKR